MNNKFKLTLASKSPRRKELLSYLNIPFEVLTSHIDEVSDFEDPKKFCMDISRKKGVDVYSSMSTENFLSRHPFVISSDTIVVKDDIIFGKPKSVEEARKTLLQLSDDIHQVITAYSFIYFDFTKKKKVEKSFAVTTDVHFYKIQKQLLEAYLLTKDSLDKAGSYGVQASAQTFIKKIERSYSSVVGLPIAELTIELSGVLSSLGFSENNWKKAFV